MTNTNSPTSDSVSLFSDFYGTPAATLYSPQNYAFDVSIGRFGEGQFLQGTNNAFDGFGRLSIGGSPFQPATTNYTTADSGQTVVTASATAAALNVTRRITVPKTGADDFAHDGCFRQPHEYRHHHDGADRGQSGIGRGHVGLCHFFRRYDTHDRRLMVRDPRRKEPDSAPLSARLWRLGARFGEGGRRQRCLDVQPHRARLTDSGTGLFHGRPRRQESHTSRRRADGQCLGDVERLCGPSRPRAERDRFVAVVQLRLRCRGAADDRPPKRLGAGRHARA